MININLTSRISSSVIGILIYFVPFFTYLSPHNLKQISGSAVAEIFLSLIALLIVIFIISFSIEIIIKRFFKKNIILFPLLCFAFYLNFLYTPFFEFFQEYIFTTFNFIAPIGIGIFIFFELFCLIIIILGAKFNIFANRVILIFSILMLAQLFLPLASYLFEKNLNKTLIVPKVSEKNLVQDEVLIKRNVYYIIMDAMMGAEAVEPLNVATKKEIIDILSNTGLTLIDKSLSSYSETKFAIKAMMFADYHKIPSSQTYSDHSNLFPDMLYSIKNEVPLFTYLKKANSSFVWMPGKDIDCIPTIRWTCINSSNNSQNRLLNLSINLWNFSSTTPLPNILKRFINDIRSQDTIRPFLEYIDNNGIPKTPFFAYIQNNIPHPPHLVTTECKPTNNFDTEIKGYKASYQCALMSIQKFMEKINHLDPEAIVIFQGDHGMKHMFNMELTTKEKYLFSGNIFNAIKAPEICFKKYGFPKTTVNTARFALNCAYGFKLPFREDIHYMSKDYGKVIERKIYQ